MGNDDSYRRDPAIEKLLAINNSIRDQAYFEQLDELDFSARRPNDVSMTDMTRQQVTDLLAASEAKNGERLANFQLDIKSGFADLRAEFAQVRAEMANDRAAALKQSNESQRWIVTAVFAMISIAVAVIGALINFSKSDKHAAMPPAPIIITVPTTAAPPPGAVIRPTQK